MDEQLDKLLEDYGNAYVMNLSDLADEEDKWILKNTKDYIKQLFQKPINKEYSDQIKDNK